MTLKSYISTINVYFPIIKHIIVLNFVLLHRTQNWRRSQEGLPLSWLKRASLVSFKQAHTESSPELYKKLSKIWNAIHGLKSTHPSFLVHVYKIYFLILLCFVYP